MNWILLLRVGIPTVLAALLAVSLIGIVLTGPVVRQPPALELDIDVSEARLRATVEILCGEFAPRDAEHPENLDRAADWIAAAFVEADLAVEFQEYRARGRSFRNVIARRPGSDPDAGIIVIGAHYDAFGGHPGANDNASGVAVLLELVRTLPTDHPRHPNEFVAFSTEEPPFFRSEEMGSYVYASRLLDRDVPVSLMLSLDTVGYYSDEPDSQHFPFRGLELFYPDRGNFAAIIGDLQAGRWIGRVKSGMLAAEAIPVHSFRASPRWAPIDLSDHASFRRLGLPGVQITDTAFMRFPHYHTAEDTPEKLDYERMGQLVRALHGVIWEGHPAPSGR